MSLKPKRVNFEETWARILEAVKVVLVGGYVERSTWNDRFSDVYALCVAYPEPLGDKLYNSTRTYLEEHIKERQLKVNENGEENLLITYFQYWKEYSQGCSYLNQLFGYLNSQYIRKQKISDADRNYGGFTVDIAEQVFEIEELGLDVWKRLMVEPIKDSLVSLLLKEIQSDRLDGGSLSQTIVQGVVLSFVEFEKYKSKNPLKYYEEVFEEPMLQQTSDYYRHEALKLLDSNNCSEYMIKVIQHLNDESLRAKKFLNSSSFDKVIGQYQQRVVADHLQFLHRECRGMVQKEKREDLNNMYRLLHPIHTGLGVLIQEVEDHIKQMSLDIVKSLDADNVRDNVSQQFVESMLEIHSKYTELIQNVFASDQQFIGALDKACSAAINYRHKQKAQCRAPELLAKYCDTLLKKSVKGMNESETDDKLSSSITVFKYLDDKDIFNRFYARMLAKRLIYGQSQSMDAEESMINRLKQACGYEFTNKLHRMFTDMNISNDLNAKFSSFLKESSSADLGVNFSILVLQAGAWPIGQSNLPTFALPQELEKSVQMFEQFYSKNFTGRKLAWIHAFCQCEVKVNHLKRPYFITMGTFLMAILLPFNQLETISFRDLLEITRLPDSELSKQVQQLVEAKLLVLNGENFDANSTFSLNMSYNNKRTKFKIMSAQKDSVQEVEQTRSAVDEDRKIYLQAAIVRIMKARKVLKHNLLIQEVLSQSQSRFAPSIHVIKKSIETLIDKTYIERTANSTDEYSYIA